MSLKNGLPKILVCNFTLRASQPLQYANLLIPSDLELFVLSVSFRVVLRGRIVSSSSLWHRLGNQLASFCEKFHKGFFAWKNWRSMTRIYFLASASKHSTSSFNCKKGSPFFSVKRGSHEKQHTTLKSCKIDKVSISKIPNPKSCMSSFKECLIYWKCIWISPRRKYAR